jgi:hypothetical protein
MSIGQARPVAGEAADLDELTPWGNCWESMARRQPHDLLLATIKERIGVDDEGVGAPCNEDCKSRFEVAVGRSANHDDLLSAGARDRLQSFHVRRVISVVGVDEGVPGLARVAVLVPRIARNLFASAQEAPAKALGIELLYIDLPGPEAAGTAMSQAISAGAQGALMRVGPFFSSSQRQAIVDLAAELRLPVMYERRDYIEQGGLLTYVPDLADLYRRAAGYVVAILAGADPGDLPIEQPTKFELVINLKTAKALGLNVPPKLLALADEVIE